MVFVEVPVLEAVVELAEEAVEQVVLCVGVPVPGLVSAAVVGAGLGEVRSGLAPPRQRTRSTGGFRGGPEAPGRASLSEGLAGQDVSRHRPGAHVTTTNPPL